MKRSINENVLTMDKLLIGTGWSKVEYSGCVYYRWMNSQNEATIHLDIDRSIESRVNICLYDFNSEEVLSNINLYADDIKLQLFLGQERHPTFLSTILPTDKTKSSQEVTILKLKIKDPLANFAIKKQNNNKKQFGVALHNINIFPLRRSLFTANKHSDTTLFDGLQYMREKPGVKDAVIHGTYSSAYDHFIKHYQEYKHYYPVLHEKFDECPGDIYDILWEEKNEHVRDIEESMLEDIQLLREIIQRQGNTIRDLKAKLAHKE